MISVYQIYFDDNTKKYLDKGFIPHFNDKKDGYFENSVIKNIYEKINATPETFLQADKYIGISSWKQRSRTRLRGVEIISHIKKDIETGKEKDVYLYTPIPRIEYTNGTIPEGYKRNAIIKAPDMWAQHKAYGTGQPYKDDILLNNARVLPFDMFDGKWMFSHRNYWIARKEVFNEYCEKVLLPAIAFFEQPEIKQQMPVWYEHSYEGKKYNSCCFIMEGLFGAFLAHTNYSWNYIYKKKINKTKFLKINIIKYENYSSHQ